MFTVVVIIMLMSSILIAKTDIQKNNQQQDVLGQWSESLSETLTPSPTATPTLILSPQPTPTPSKAPISQIFNLEDFKYPSSKQISCLENNCLLESNDNHDLITNWYEEKIKSLGFKSKSFVKTSSNGKVLNKLVGGMSDREVRVEIEKLSGESKISIKVSLLDT